MPSPSGMPRSLSRKRAPFSSTSSGRRCPALEKVNSRVDGLSTANSMVTNLPEGKSSTSRRFRRVRTSPGPLQVCARERSMPRVADISRAAAVPFPETSASTRPQHPSSNEMKSYQSPPTAPAGIDSPEIAKPGMNGELLGSSACWMARASLLLVAHRWRSCRSC